MKLYCSLIALILVGTGSIAQILPGHKVSGPITILDTLRVNVGDTLHLGQGSGSNKGFIYFFDGQRHTGRSDMANGRVIIKGLKLSEEFNMGKKYYALVNPGGLFNWAIDLENAIRSGEVIGINKIRFNTNNTPGTIIQNKQSVADELIKLKRLLDQGAITKEEYDAQKKKLLKE